MLKKLMMAALATGALALSAPAALADAPTYDCNFNSVQQDDATGQNYEGVAWGYVVHAEGGPVSIRCYITVNGAEVASTPTGTGTGAATTSGRVTFAAEDTDHVQLWAEVTTTHGSVSTPYESEHTQVPPQEVIDALNGIEVGIIDPLLCPVLAGLAGDYAGVIVINSQGDVFLAGEPFWDCPPYDLFG